eukprot:jgi/Ulvmu1/8193/UM041_0001.1
MICLIRGWSRFTVPDNVLYTGPPLPADTPVGANPHAIHARRTLVPPYTTIGVAGFSSVEPIYRRNKAQIVGWAIANVSQMDKAPNVHGGKAMCIESLLLTANRTLPLVGNAVVELGIAMGVLQVEKLNNLQHGEFATVEKGIGD